MLGYIATQNLDNPLLEDPVSVTSLQIPTKTDILNLALPLSNEKPLATFSDPSLPVGASHLLRNRAGRRFRSCRNVTACVGRPPVSNEPACQMVAYLP